MNIKSLALVLGATVALVGGGLGAVACSSSSSAGSSSSSSSGGSSGGSSGSSSGSTMDSGNNEDTGSGSSSGGSSDAGAICDSSIPTLHTNPAGDIYCGFGAGDSGSISCVADSGTGWCCLGGKVGMGYAPQICGATQQDCVNDGTPDAGMGGYPVQCNQIGDCAGNGAPGATACCLQGGATLQSVAACGYQKAVGGNAVMCEGTGGGAATMCAAGEIQLCLQDTDCPSPMTCKAGKWKIFQVGFCM